MVNWYKKNKLIFHIIVGILTVLFATVASKYTDVVRLTDVAVNEETGQIALTYFTSDLSGAVLTVFDSEGTILFEETYNCNQGGDVYIQYIDNSLHMYVTRTNTLFSYDDQFNETTTESETLPQTMHQDHWIHWEGAFHHKTRHSDQFQLIYDEPNLFESIFSRKDSSLVLTKPNGEKIKLF